VASALSRHGVNIKSLAGLAVDGHVMIRVIADDVQAAREALEGNGIRYEEGEVISVLLENQAGELASLSAKLSEAGVNMLGIYVTGASGNLVELAVVCDNPKKAKKLLE
jgi:hypothetical protein